jgi:hypothetical protein
MFITTWNQLCSHAFLKAIALLVDESTRLGLELQVLVYITPFNKHLFFLVHDERHFLIEPHMAHRTPHRAS